MSHSLVSSVLVGRARELESLSQALSSSQNGQGRCVLLAGEAGIGKSRLAAELQTRAAAAGFSVLLGHCVEQDASFPYAPWIDGLRAYLAPKSPGETSELLGGLASVLVKLLPELSLLIPAIQPAFPLEPEAEKHRVFESLARLCASLAASKPLLIVLEDLHWSDEPSLELLHFVARRIAALPILLVGTYRGEEISPRLAHYLAELNRERVAQEVRLAPLARHEVEQLVRARGMPEQSIARVFEDLARLSEGNPFFVEEILKTFAEAGETGSLQIPHSIRDSVQRRAAQLPERHRQVLSFAAVIGERFDFGLLQAVAGQDEQSLVRIVKDLIAAQLLVEQSADQLAFRHALTREAVFAGLMRRERKAMHQIAGETIERLAGARADASAAQLAYHFYQGGVWPKALLWSQRAGAQVQALYAPREAVDHFTHALEAAGQLGIAAPRPALRARAAAREILGEFDGARADFEAVLAAARAVSDRADEWQALIDLGLLWQSRDLKRAGEYYQLALDLARSLGDESMLAHALNRAGNWRANRGRPFEALPLHEEALSRFRALNDRHGVARTLDLLALVTFQLGDVIEGTAWLEQAMPILREVDDRQALVNTLTNMASLANYDTEVLGAMTYPRFADLSDEAREIARGFNWSRGEALALIAGAISLGHTGNYARAWEWLGRAQALVDASGQRESLARLQLASGQILAGLLAFAEARPRLESSLALAQELGSGLFTLAATARLVTTLVLQKDLARAKELLDALPATGYPEGRISIHLRRLWVSRAQFELAQGRPDRALDIVERLVATTANLVERGPYAVPYMSRLRAQALAALDRIREAEAELQGTLPVAIAQGRRSLEWQLRADLGAVYLAHGRSADAESEFTAARAIIQDLASHVPDPALRDQFLERATTGIPEAPLLTPRQAAKRQFGGLTAREREIATLVARGKSNRDIAGALVISEATAERHLANIMSKLGFNSRTQIAVWAVEKGLG